MLSSHRDFRRSISWRHLSLMKETGWPCWYPSENFKSSKCISNEQMRDGSERSLGCVLVSVWLLLSWEWEPFVVAISAWWPPTMMKWWFQRSGYRNGDGPEFRGKVSVPIGGDSHYDPKQLRFGNQSNSGLIQVLSYVLLSKLFTRSDSWYHHLFKKFKQSYLPQWSEIV